MKTNEKIKTTIGFNNNPSNKSRNRGLGLIAPINNLSK